MLNYLEYAAPDLKKYQVFATDNDKVAVVRLSVNKIKGQSMYRHPALDIVHDKVAKYTGVAGVYSHNRLTLNLKVSPEERKMLE